MVEGTCDMTPKSGTILSESTDNQQKRRREMKVTVTVTFLRSKRLDDDSLLLHFGCFSRGVKKFFSLITKHYLLFFWSNNNLSRHCVYLP